jgi:acyl transferase domain-containing protein/NADPH:quinone reductase-like Zn-dependent oxidoreductase/acyl carrier protein
MRSSVAIVGIAGIFPGATDFNKLWQNVIGGVESVRTLTDSELVSAGVSPRAFQQRNYVRVASVLPNVALFDAEFFGYSPREASLMDPQHRLFLETAWHAMEDAGLAPGSSRGATTAVFASASGSVSSYAHSDERHWRALHGATASVQHQAGDKDFLATRVSYKLNLGGPSVAIQTASSSSLVAVHFACQSLMTGESDVALAGGTAVRVPHTVGHFAEDGGILSHDGHCRPFDAKASGTIFGNGVAVIVLKRLEDAVADKDRIYAVIKASVVNNDGAGKSTYAVSSPEGVERACASALADAKIDARRVGLVEAHATGTSRGDPIEFSGLSNAFRRTTQDRGFCAIGSVKANIGHLDAAAGITGLVKAALALHHRVLPPTINVDTVNPLLRAEESPFYVNTSARPWASDAPRVATVSSLGMGGTNAHVVLEEAPSFSMGAPAVERTAHVLTLSARSDEALISLAGTVADDLRAARSSLGDVCFAANTGRAALSHRMAVVGQSAADVAERLDWLARGGAAASDADQPLAFSGRPEQAPKIAFLFPGQGGQHVGMVRELMATQPTFRRTIERCDEICRKLDIPLLELLASSDAEQLDLTINAQPVLFAVDYALAALLAEWGIRPSACMGHSFGEIPAACVAGLISVEDGLFLSAHRGRLMQSVSQSGAMANVFAPEAVVLKSIEAEGTQLSIVAHNAPDEWILSGSAEAIDRTIARLEGEGIRARRLRLTGVASHSPQVDPILDEYERRASEIAHLTSGHPDIEVFSTLTGTLAAPGDLSSARYWRRQLREPVRCFEALNALYERGYTAFIEVAPNASLTFSARAVGASRGDETSLCVSVLRKKRSDWEQLAGLLAALHVRGTDVDWAAFDRDYTRRRVDFAPYPFQRQAYWIDEAADGGSRSDRSYEGARSAAGERVRSPALRDVVYEQPVADSLLLFEDEYTVCGKPLAPLSGCLAIVEAAVIDATGIEHIALQDVTFLESLDTSLPRVLQVIVRNPGPGGERRFQLCSRPARNAQASWTVHVEGCIRTSDATVAAGKDRRNPDFREAKASWTSLETAPFYQHLESFGVRRGRRGQLVTGLWKGPTDAVARVEGSRDERPTDEELLEAGMQVMLAMLPPISGDEAVYLPLGAVEIQFHRPLAAALWVRVSNVQFDASGAVCTGDIEILADDGTVVGRVRGYCLKRIHRETLLTKGRESSDWSYEVAWHPSPVAAAADAGPGSWVVLADAAGLGDRVIEALRTRGDQVLAVPSLERGKPDDAELKRAIAALGTTSLPLRGVVNLWPLDASLSKDGDLAGALERACGGSIFVASAVAGVVPAPRVLLVTRGGQPVLGSRVELAQTPASGLLRVLAQEHPELTCTSLDLDPDAPEQDLPSVLGAALQPDAERQIAFRGKQRYVGRLVRSSASRRRIAVPSGAFQMKSARGLLENIAMVPLESRAPGDGEVSIRVKALGVTFRDVLNVMGVTEEGETPGFECSGVVTAVGPGVRDCAIGDEVVALASTGFASQVIADARLVAPKPKNVTFEEAAALPASFVTAHYALGNAKKGDRVLIHAAAGGVGLAAVELARRLELTVFATASPTKWTFLRSRGVERVVSSRNATFGEELQKAYGKLDIDIVLHSLQSRMRAPGLATLRDGGRLVDVSARPEPCPEGLAERGLQCSVFDLKKHMADRPEEVGEALRSVVAWIDSGAIRPLPIRVFAPDDTVTAFRTLSSARHVSKVIISVGAPLVNTIAAPPNAISYGGTCVVAAGAEPLTKAIIHNLADAGARHVLVLGKPFPIEAPAGLEVRWADVDVSSASEVASVLRTEPPVRAAVFIEKPVTKGQVTERGNELLADALPQIRAAWALHSALENLPLDFCLFVANSAAVLGAPHMGARSVVGSFLDGLSHKRRAQGVSGTSIHWGPWEFESDGHWATGAAGTVSLEQGMRLLLDVIHNALPPCVLLPIRWASAVQQQPSLRGDPLFSRLLDEATDPRRRRDEAAPLVSELRELKSHERRPHLLRFLEGVVVKTLGMSAAKSLDPQQGFRDLGLDSMMSVELRNKLQIAINHSLPYALTFNCPNLNALTSHIYALLFPEVPEEEKAPGPAEAAASSELDDASLNELERLLEQELESLNSTGLVSSVDREVP